MFGCQAEEQECLKGRVVRSFICHLIGLCLSSHCLICSIAGLTHSKSSL